MFVLAVVWPGLKKKPHSWRWWSLCVATQSKVVCCVVLAMRAHEKGGTVAGSQNQHALGLYMKKPSRTVASPWDQEEQLDSQFLGRRESPHVRNMHKKRGGDRSLRRMRYQQKAERRNA